MKNFFIKRYIDKMTIQDVINFANSSNIVLTQEQLIYVYNLIKNNWRQILNNDDSILDKLKKEFNSETSKKIEKLYYEYKAKYQNYLN